MTSRAQIRFLLMMGKKENFLQFWMVLHQVVKKEIEELKEYRLRVIPGRKLVVYPNDMVRIRYIVDLAIFCSAFTIFSTLFQVPVIRRYIFYSCAK